MKFFKNDIVRNNKVPHLISRVLSTQQVENETYLTLGNGMYINETLVQEWKPLKNETCWFWDYKDNLQLREFEKMDANRFQPFGSVMGFIFCEPFFGELPTILNKKSDKV